MRASNSALSRDKRVGAAPLDRGRARQNDHPPPAFLDKPAHQAFAVDDNLQFAVQPGAHLLCALTLEHHIPIDLAQGGKMFAPRFLADGISQKVIRLQPQLSRQKPGYFFRNYLTRPEQTPGKSKPAKLKRKADLVLRAPTRSNMGDVIVIQNIVPQQRCFISGQGKEVCALALGQNRSVSHWQVLSSSGELRKVDISRRSACHVFINVSIWKSHNLLI